MRVNCEHSMCDLCLTKDCNSPGLRDRLKQFGSLYVCPACIHRAVESAYDFASRWGGIIEKPCGQRKEGQ